MKINLKKINWEIVGLGMILAFATFLRIYSLGSPSFWVDESTSTMAAKMILEKGVPIFDSGLYYSRALFFHYSQAISMILGLTDFLARFSSVIFGLLTIVLGYFIGKEYSKKGGIIVALFLSVFFLEVFFSRQARFYQLFQLLFFASLYFLYKSKDNKKFILPSLICFFLTLDTQIEGLVLAPFFILFGLFYWKRKWLVAIPTIPLIKKFLSAIGLTSGEPAQAVNYISEYFSYMGNMIYVGILSIAGMFIGFKKNKLLTLVILLPSIITLIGIFSLRVFAFRYAYFFVFPLVLYFGVFISYLYDKFGKIIIPLIVLLILIPSNLFFPYTAVNILKPIDYNYYDVSAPQTDYKAIPEELIMLMRENTLISYFSSDVEWYIKKPDYVIPFSMNGIGEDQISRNSTKGVVDRYSGAMILKEKPEESYYLIADMFSVSKLKEGQREFLEELIEGCSLAWDERDLRIYSCE